MKSNTGSGRRAACAAILACCASSMPAPRADAGVIGRVIVTSGDAAPGTGQFAAFSIEGPAVNDLGQVAFYAGIAGAAPGTRGIYRSDGTTTVEIVRSGQPLPGGTGTFSSFTLPVMLNDAGQVGFLSSNDHGIYRGDGSAAPVFLGSTGGAYDRFGFNAAGQASTYNGNTVRRLDTTAPQTIAQAGQPAPGGNGTLFNVYGASMNDAGHVALFATLANTQAGQGENQAIYRGDGTTLVEVARQGRPTPTGVGTYNGIGDAQINNAGRVAFFATLNGGSNWGLFTVDPDGASHEVARAGTAAPGGGTIQYSSDFYATFSLNNAGQVAFPAAVTSATSQEQAILIAGSGGGLTEVMRTGRLTPDPTRRFVGIPSGGPLALNDDGDVAFLADIIRSDASQTVPPDGRQALFVYDDALGLVEIARTGDALLGSTISQLGLSPTTGLVGDERGGLNNLDQVAYFASLADGRNVILLANVPEPATLTTLAIAACGLTLHRRRRRPSSAPTA